MEKRTLIFPAGSAIAFTSGCYSDFGLNSIVIALKEVDLPKLAQEFVANYRPEHDWDRADPDKFPTWLITNSYAMAADVQQVHLGDYGDFEPEYGIKRADD